MDNEQTGHMHGKWWPRSLTVWGAVVTALATVLPVVGPLLGLDITADVVRGLGEDLVRMIEGAGGIVGITMTIYGRARAGEPLTRREVSIRF